MPHSRRGIFGAFRWLIRSTSNSTRGVVHPCAQAVTHMAMLQPSSHLYSHIATPLQLHRPHHYMPHSCTATSLPPSQLHTSPPLSHPHGPHCSISHSCIYYTTAPIAATHAMSPHASLLHGPCCPPCSCTVSLHTSQLHSITACISKKKPAYNCLTM